MTEKPYRPTSAEFLAGIITGSASHSQSSASIQRSHRFPAHLFFQIENMAKIAGVPVSLIINQLIECGLEAVRGELPPDIAKQITQVSSDQMDRPFSADAADTKPRKARVQKPK